MIIKDLLFRLKMFNDRMEFITIFCFLLFFPEKTSIIYYLIFSILIGLFITRRAVTSGNIGISGFSLVLTGFNLILFLATFASGYIHNSILFTFDILLISIYFIFRFHESKDDIKILYDISYVIALFSFIRIVISILSTDNTFFFKNPIWAGITSGFAVIILLSKIIQKYRTKDLVLLALSAISLYMSASKAAFLGVLIFSVYILVIKKRKLLIVVLIIVIFTIIIPNPVSKMFKRSILEDPYSTNRIEIWQLSLRMFLAHPLTGVGPDNFSDFSQTFNFKQENGPANYFKTPRSPHSDYLKILAETGIPGIIFLAVFFTILLRKIFSGNKADIKKILILYILFQCLLFNIVFKLFFTFFFLYLIRSLFPDNSKYFSLTPFFNLSITFILIITITAGYIFPFIAEKNLSTSEKNLNVKEALINLKRTSKFNPLDAHIPYTKAKIYYKLFKEKSDINYFLAALSEIKNAQRLFPAFPEPRLLESDLFFSISGKGVYYEGLLDEIISPLNEYEKLNPFNPFEKLDKANIYLKFGKTKLAKRSALEALEIEPSFISAVYFLHKNINFYKSDDLFKSKVRKILSFWNASQFKQGSYLRAIYRIPEKMATEFPDLK